jgi:hypothetical protein
MFVEHRDQMLIIRKLLQGLQSRMDWFKSLLIGALGQSLERYNSLVRKTLYNWSSFCSLVTDELNLNFYNAFTKDTTEKWTIYTPNGNKVVSIQDLINNDTGNGSDHHHIMQRIVQQGLVLIHQGGAFVWPEVRIGFEGPVKHGTKWAAHKWVWNAPSQFAEVF